jgi:signal transduction histidine kinase
MKDTEKFKILFIDDEPASLTAFKSVFRDYYDIRLASSAEEGYHIMKQEHFDIVISDQRMPGMSGVEFLQRIRVEFPDTVRMLITGYADIDAVVQSINGSMVSYYFTKPYDESDMRLILDNTIEKVKLTQENRALFSKLEKLVAQLTVQKEDLEKEIQMRKSAENELTVAREKAEESSRLKSSLLANLNHEFRTPMNSILGFSDIIRNSDANMDILEMARMINFSGKRLLKTLNAIVDLARFEADRQMPNIELVNLSELAKKIINDLKDAAQRKNITFEIRVEQGVCTWFTNSFASLIITNLIDNAIKFTPAGSISMQVLNEGLTGSEHPVFRIADTGIGIPRDYHEKIFEEFRQVSDGMGRNYEGLGIGLSLSKKILNRLQGEISVTSEEGKGSEFCVHFPCCRTDADQPTERSTQYIATPAAQEEKTNRELTNAIILSVEDNENNQELIQLFLSQQYRIVKVYDGESAIRTASAQHYDLILMDINLGPGMDGIVTMQQIRTINGFKKVPIIAVTGYNSSEDRQRLFAAGFDAFLPKPFTRSELVTAISGLII